MSEPNGTAAATSTSSSNGAEGTLKPAEEALQRGHALGPFLSPALQATLEGRLQDIRWFLTDWQRGGAATAFARYQEKNGEERQVVVKVPVRLAEIRWLVRMNGAIADECAGPVVYRQGTDLGGYDLAWVVMERFSPTPLAGRLDEDAWTLFAEVAARFYARAAKYPANEPPRREEWDVLLAKAREQAHWNIVEHEQDWNQAIKAVQKVSDRLVRRWRERPCDSWCHGDLHPANAMLREGDDSRAFLVDMAEVHAGHWVEDAVYAERLFWGHPEKLLGTSPVDRIASARKEAGLSNGPDHPEYADIRRVLMAATAPAFLGSEGTPAHLRGALDVMQQALKRLGG
jgi:Phosphotransferase enzyme family